MANLKIYNSDIIDSELEFHVAHHKSLKAITARHSHDFYEIFLLTKGSVRHIINQSEYVLVQGSLVFIRPDDIHSYKKYLNQNFELFNLAFTKKVFSELVNFLGEGFYPRRLVEGSATQNVLLSEIELNLLKTKIEEIHLVKIENKRDTGTKLKILLFEIITKYFSTAPKKTNPNWLEIVKEEMHKKNNFVAGFPALIKIANKSKEHICREFRRHYDTTPTEFINHLRLNYSANLLANTDENITHIALEAGFENLSHFYHLFRERFEISPSKFRRKNQKSVVPVE